MKVTKKSSDSGAPSRVTGSCDPEVRLPRRDRRSRSEMRLQRRVALHSKQVLRYAYGGGPLWCNHPSPLDPLDEVTKGGREVELVFPCDRCGTPANSSCS